MKFGWVLIGILLLATIPLQLAAQTVPDSLVPENCIEGCPCSLCDLYNLAKNVMDFLLFSLSVPIGAAMFLYGGVMLLTSGGSENKLSRGKHAITGAVVGMALAFFAWAIMNVVLTVVGFQIDFKEGLKSWYQPPSCKGGGGDNTCNIKLPVVEIPPLVQAGWDFTGTIDDSCWKDGFNICTQAGIDQLNGNEAVHQEGKGRVAVNLDKYDKVINDLAARYGVTPEEIKAIIALESQGNEGATHKDKDGGSSYGLMQVRLDTARRLDPELARMSDADAIARLSAPAYNLWIGTKYYSDMKNKYSDPKYAGYGVDPETLAAAAYNGGPGANEKSVNCPGQARWQCGWDVNGCYGNSAAQQTKRCQDGRNKGYDVTRTYTSERERLEGEY